MPASQNNNCVFLKRQFDKHSRTVRRKTPQNMQTKFKTNAFVCVCVCVRACIFITLKQDFLSFLPPLQLRDPATSVTCLQACHPVFLCEIELITVKWTAERALRHLSLI